jgi:hypothetical protein
MVARFGPDVVGMPVKPRGRKGVEVTVGRTEVADGVAGTAVSPVQAARQATQATIQTLRNTC